jgi:hypothetical protein
LLKNIRAEVRATPDSNAVTTNSPDQQAQLITESLHFTLNKAPISTMAAMSRERIMMRVAPVIFCFVTFLLLVLALFAGNQPGVLEGYDMLTVSSLPKVILE